mmetsp:Transcript_2022/g.6398  ORF Transcript_2022/g.6398 Transcript_2022/m.6398 type:complete len:244 (+) Transcript_2022:1369-2100(+)
MRDSSAVTMESQPGNRLVVESTAAALGSDVGAREDARFDDAWLDDAGGFGIVAPCGNQELSEAATRLAVSATVASPINPDTALLATVVEQACAVVVSDAVSAGGSEGGTRGCASVRSRRASESARESRRRCSDARCSDSSVDGARLAVACPRADRPGCSAAMRLEIPADAPSSPFTKAMAAEMSESGTCPAPGTLCCCVWPAAAEEAVAWAGALCFCLGTTNNLSRNAGGSSAWAAALARSTA